MVNEIPSLGGNHLLFVREHNRIVGELRKVQPKWSSLKLYQEARKIIGALLQQVTYGEFLPSILSKQDLENHKLKLRNSGFSNNYDSSRNPATKNAFNAAVFRFGHSLVSILSNIKAWIGYSSDNEQLMIDNKLKWFCNI